MKDRCVVGVDGSAFAMRAIDHALWVLRGHADAELIAVNVQPPAIELKVMGMDDRAMAALYEHWVAESTREALATIERSGVRHRLIRRYGDPAEELVEVAHGEAARLIVLGTRGMGRTAAFLLGSVAYKTVHLSRVPVALVK